MVGVNVGPTLKASPLPGVAGKVYVSHIVDYLRHTTSRSSEDSGLEELCNMLDPEHKDVSIDLDTYHAVMREWIDDCRNNGYRHFTFTFFKIKLSRAPVAMVTEPTSARFSSLSLEFHWGGFVPPHL